MTNRNEYLFEYRVRTYMPLVIFSFVATGAVMLSFIGRTIRFFLRHDVSIAETIFAGLLSFLFLQISLWFLRGQERIIVKDDNFIFVRSNGLLTLKKSIQIKEIEGVTINTRTFPNDTFLDRNRQQIKEMQGALIFWRKMGRLEFKIGKNYKSFFNGLTETDSNEIIQTLSKIIHGRQTDKRNST